MMKFLFPLASAWIAMSMALGGWQQAAAQTAEPSSKSVEAPSPKAPGLTQLTELSAEQLAVAKRVAVGKMPCELTAYVVVKPDTRGPGRFTIEWSKMKYAMVPVPTATGAIRLEDKEAGVVWLQLSSKSMLMNERASKRLADACTSAEQLMVAKELERDPALSLLGMPVRPQAGDRPGLTPATPQSSVPQLF